jgi:hypothetical protein
MSGSPPAHAAEARPAPAVGGGAASQARSTKPRKRANRRCRWRAYHACRALSRVRRARVPSTANLPFVEGPRLTRCEPKSEGERGLPGARAGPGRCGVRAKAQPSRRDSPNEAGTWRGDNPEPGVTSADFEAMVSWAEGRNGASAAPGRARAQAAPVRFSPGTYGSSHRSRSERGAPGGHRGQRLPSEFPVTGSSGLGGAIGWDCNRRAADRPSAPFRLFLPPPSRGGSRRSYQSPGWR